MTQRLQERVPANQASPFFLLAASDAAPGTTPQVFKVTVDSAGTLKHRCRYDGQSSMNAHAPHPFQAKLDRALKVMGGLYTAADIIAKVQEHTMQMFCLNDSIAVTQINIFPQKRVLHIIVAVGDIDDLRVLHDRLMIFAKDMKVDLIQAHGRRGWVKDAIKNGWRNVAKSTLYQKAIT